MIRTGLTTMFLLLTCCSAFGAVAKCSPNGPLANFATDAYGERIEFDVYRNEKLVGRHVTEFSDGDDGLRVKSLKIDECRSRRRRPRPFPRRLRRDKRSRASTASSFGWDRRDERPSSNHVRVGQAPQADEALLHRNIARPE